MKDAMNAQPKILYVEDDPNLAFLTKETLEQNGYAVHHEHNPHEAIAAFEKEEFDICLLDIILENELDGFDLVKKIRKSNVHIPVLFITAKVLQEDRIKGLSLGADDYILKPYSIEELLLRIKVFLKRGKVKIDSKETIGIGHFEFVPLEQKLLSQSESKKLTKRETEVLMYFVERANKLVYREKILEDVWGKNDYFLGRSLDVFVTRLRKYLEKDASIQLETIHGVGFRLLASVS